MGRREKKLTELKGETDKFAIISEDSNTPYCSIKQNIDRISAQIKKY